MSLGAALQISQNSLANVSRQTNTVARNITDAADPSYSRRYSVVESQSLGSRVSVLRVQIDQNLIRSGLEAQSQSSAQSILAEQLGRLGEALNGVDGERSVFTSLGSLQDRLQMWSTEPSNSLLAAATLQDAKSLADNLNSASAEVQRQRTAADKSIANDVSSLNKLLEEFHQANGKVTDGNHLGEPDFDALDQRAALLGEISQLVPVATISRENGDMALFTGGRVLFETIPRRVAFKATASLGPGQVGGVVTVDGLRLRAGENANTTARGSIAANLQLRDRLLPQAQSQLDEIARGVIAAFAETGSGVQAQTGLFTYPGAPSVPPNGAVVSGLSASISLNGAYDPAAGGTMNLLRDGGANGAPYVANTAGENGFADRLISLNGQMDATQTFDASTGLNADQGLVAYSNAAIGWLDGLTSQAGRERDVRQAVNDRFQTSLSEARGVDIDAELSRLLELERTYEASARMISAVDEMLATLLAVAR